MGPWVQNAAFCRRESHCDVCPVRNLGRGRCPRGEVAVRRTRESGGRLSARTRRGAATRCCPSQRSFGKPRGTGLSAVQPHVSISCGPLRRHHGPLCRFPPTDLNGPTFSPKTLGQRSAAPMRNRAQHPAPCVYPSGGCLGTSSAPLPGRQLPRRRESAVSRSQGWVTGCRTTSSSATTSGTATRTIARRAAEGHRRPCEHSKRHLRCCGRPTGSTRCRGSGTTKPTTAPQGAEVGFRDGALSRPGPLHGRRWRRRCGCMGHGGWRERGR
jgi:hypothetical protein